MTSLSPETSKDRERPENKTFDEVDTQFNGFRERRAQRIAEGRAPDDFRGGVDYPDKKTVKEFGEHRTADYHRESSFDPKEQVYVARAMSLLNKLADGDNGRHLADIIVDHFKYGENITFLAAIDIGIKQLLKEFSDQYPTLMPAMDSMYEIGGGEGTRVAISMCRKMITENYKAYQGLPALPMPVLKLEEMASQHPSDATGEEPYSTEILCSGMPFAAKILEQAGEASYDVAEYILTHGMDIQKVIDTDNVFVSDQEQMSGTVHMLYEKIKNEDQKGESSGDQAIA